MDQNNFEYEHFLAVLRFEKFPLTDVNLTNYNIDYMPTKANKGGVFLYISNKLNYKAKNNLQVNIDKKACVYFY